ncbi:hypothetical protein EV182_002045 [Spiromyces aspiralis]|uniref:Uncharacterized protein n=1 Tax=Spiromyces aspiralis TaxID=68401 RepID=A0ACC1HEQ9_9FUNG|nr:hypothetical protein EV182_002045 [Spiromyces aspiralis]
MGDEYTALFLASANNSSRSVLISRSTFALRRVLYKLGIEFSMPFARSRKPRGELDGAEEPRDRPNADPLYLNDKTIDNTWYSQLKLDKDANVEQLFRHIVQATGAGRLRKGVSVLCAPMPFLNATMCRARVYASSVVQHTPNQHTHAHNGGTSVAQFTLAKIFKVEVTGLILPSGWRALLDSLPLLASHAEFSISSAGEVADTANFVPHTKSPPGKPLPSKPPLYRNVIYSRDGKYYFKAS